MASTLVARGNLAVRDKGSSTLGVYDVADRDAGSDKADDAPDGDEDDTNGTPFR